MRYWRRSRVCLAHQAGPARPAFLPHRWGRLLPIVLQDALTEREENVGPGDRKVQLPGTKVCQTHACPPDRKAGPWFHSVLPSCWATPQAMLYPFWALVGDRVQEALSVYWLREGIPEEYAQDLGLPRRSSTIQCTIILQVLHRGRHIHRNAVYTLCLGSRIHIIRQTPCT